MSGAEQPASSIRCLISGTAAAASGRLTVTRTISDPASARSIHCCAVDRASAVSVNVIDCTTIGAPPPTWTWPTLTPVVRCSFTSDMNLLMVAFAAGKRTLDPGVENMRAIVVRQLGGPEMLKLEDVPRPAPHDGEVLVRMRAAGVNPVDTYIRAG